MGKGRAEKTSVFDSEMYSMSWQTVKHLLVEFSTDPSPHSTCPYPLPFVPVSLVQTTPLNSASSFPKDHPTTVSLEVNEPFKALSSA